MTIRIITVGNKSNSHYSDLIADYQKRFPRHINVEWVYIKHATGDIETSKQQESDAILKLVPDGSYLILLDETGKQLTSTDLSQKIFASNTHFTFVIGGAYGVTERLRSKANFIWSLSMLVFPHHIARLLLIEQLYRAYSISIDHPYHHK